MSFMKWMFDKLTCWPCLMVHKRRDRVLRRIGMRRLDRELDILRFFKRQFTIDALLKALTTKE